MEQSMELLKQTMDQLGYDYSDVALDWLANSDHEGPFHMVNLHKFYEHAQYPDEMKAGVRRPVPKQTDCTSKPLSR